MAISNPSSRKKTSQSPEKTAPRLPKLQLGQNPDDGTIAFVQPRQAKTPNTSQKVESVFLLPVSPQAARMMGCAVRAFGTVWKDVINYERYSGRYDGCFESTSLEDLRTAATNFRELDRQASAIRLQDEEHREEFDCLQEHLDQDRREMEVLYPLAELEVLLLPRFDLAMQFYTYAIFSAYVSAAFVISSIFDLGGDRRRFRALEDYVEGFRSIGQEAAHV